MEDTCKALVAMYDDMLGYLKSFKHNNYKDIMEEMDSKYRDLVITCGELCREAGEKRDVVIATFADAISDHVISLMEEVPKRKKEIKAVDYNMVMAVYFVPIMRYTKDAECNAIADKIIAVWNEKHVTPLTLQSSTYEDVLGGFKKGILCYITTAVCEYQHKPDDCYELMTLRDYRDHYLMQTDEGRQLVEEYYDIAPRIVWAIGMQPDAADIYDALYEEYLMPCIHYVENGQNEDCKKLYVDMVRGLEEKYIS